MKPGKYRATIMLKVQQFHQLAVFINIGNIQKGTQNNDHEFG